MRMEEEATAPREKSPKLQGGRRILYLRQPLSGPFSHKRKHFFAKSLETAKPQGLKRLEFRV